METQKLSYYQKNKEKILAKRKMQREKQAKLGRPFLNDDEDIILKVDNPLPITEPAPEPAPEPTPDPTPEPVKKVKKAKKIKEVKIM